MPGRRQIPVTFAKTWGQMENPPHARPSLVAPSHSPSRLLHVSSHLAHPAPLPGLPALLHARPQATASPFLPPLPGSALLPLGASCARPSPLLSFVEAAPLGHEARGGAVAVGGRELHVGRGDRRGGRELSQTHSQPGDRGKAGRTTDQEQGQREPEVGLARTCRDPSGRLRSRCWA